MESENALLLFSPAEIACRSHRLLGNLQKPIYGLSLMYTFQNRDTTTSMLPVSKQCSKQCSRLKVRTLTSFASSSCSDLGKLFPRVYLRAAGGCALGCICTAQADVSAPNTSYGSCSSGDRLLALNGVGVEVALTRRFKPCG